jgi:hypothetical protein
MTCVVQARAGAVLVFVLAAVPVAGQPIAPRMSGEPQATGDKSQGGGQDSSSQATDPTASLMAMNIISDFTIR